MRKASSLRSEPVGIQGRRVDDGTDPRDYVPGNYGRWEASWAVRPPAGDAVVLSGHEIILHSNGSISASPAITTPVWQGVLERGVWREAS